MGFEQTDIQQMRGERRVETAMRQAGLFFFLLMIIEMPYSVLVHFVQIHFDEQYSTLISVLMTQGYLLLAAFVYVAFTGKRLTEDLQICRYKVSTFFLSLVVLMVASPMAGWLNILSQLFAKNTTGSAIYDITQSVPAWLAVLIIGCLPGFVEETIYRGIMYSAFRQRSVLTGVMISGLSFGLMHMNFNQILYAIYLGIVFALLVEATGSLVSTMILHMLFNAINTAYLYILPKMYAFLGKFYEEYAAFDLEAELAKTPDKSQLIVMLEAMMPMAVVGILLMVLLLKSIAKINGREFTWKSICAKKEEGQGTRPVTVFLILGWMFCLIFAFLNLFGG